jgi:asparagine synthase (glutamine-hydrolysing)
MATALGDFFMSVSNGDVANVPPALRDASCWPEYNNMTASVRAFSPAPHVALMVSGDVQYVAASDAGGRGGVALAREPEQGGAVAEPQEIANQSIMAWLDDAQWQPAGHGRYVYLFWDATSREATAFCDMFRTYPVYYTKTADGFICASDMRLILLALGRRPTVNKSGIYHYLNFAYIPSPHTIIDGVSKLEPGYRLDASLNAFAARSVTDAVYPEDIAGDDRLCADRLHTKIVDTVSSYRPSDKSSWGTFLSGGTDSSSITGILARVNQKTRVDSFSIGFAEAGYDEMSYSRIAAKHFDLNSHELNVDENDAVALIPRLAKAFAEPFGNASAIPTFYCADLARKNGKEFLIAGDGGDEIFGGNERYAKDQIFTWYHHAPAPIRWLGALVAKLLSGFDFSIARRVSNMVRRGQMPNPDRFYSDDSFASDHFDELLTSAFRAAIKPDESLDIQRGIFNRVSTKSELHRLMYLDLKLTIAESDLVKVITATKLAGVDVAFPYLDRRLVDYTGKLPARFKVKGLKKRYLFMKAMESILPIEIRQKKKQGFGLPVAVWLRRKGKMHHLVNSVVLSERALSRGYFNAEFICNLIAQHECGSWDYSSEIFRLLMLELWHKEYLDVLEP